MDTFQLEFITPESRYYSGLSSMVEIPGAMGDFGVLAGHSPFVSTIRPGVVTIHERGSGEDAPGLAGGGRISKIFVVGGIAEVNPFGCTVLAERVIDISGMTSLDAQARLNEVKAKLEKTFEPTEREDLENEQRIAEAIFAAVV